MKNSIAFELRLTDQESIEIQSNQFAQQSILTFLPSPYIVKRSDGLEVATASFSKNLLLVEHHLLRGSASHQSITIIAKRHTYVLIICLQGQVAYSSKKDAASNLKLLEREAIFLFAKKGTYLALPLRFPAEVLTISIHPKILPFISPNQFRSTEFMFQQKSFLLTYLDPVGFKTSFLNKLKGLIESYTQRTELNVDLIKHVSEILLIYFKQLDTETRPSFYRSIVEGTNQMIHEDLQKNERPNLNDLAKRNRISVSSLELGFKEITGKTVRRHIKSALLHRISEILVQTDIPLLELSILFGYADTNSLNRIFKRTFGITMGSYRKQYGESSFSK